MPDCDDADFFINEGISSRGDGLEKVEIYEFIFSPKGDAN